MARPVSAPFFKTLAGGLFSLALTAAILVAGASSIRNREEADGMDFALEVPDVGIVEEVPPEENIPPAPAFPGDTDDAVLSEDIAPAQPAPEPDASGEAAAAPPAEAAPPARELVPLAQPVVLIAGRLSFSGRTLELAGIRPVPIGQQCTAPSGGRWPCGRMARTAFGTYLRGRTLDCDVPGPEWNGTITARCMLAGKDISLWLAENGWAEATEGSDLEDVAAAARKAERGLHGPDPRRLANPAEGADGSDPAAEDALPLEPDRMENQ
ncbi:MAG: thermonuclease family protein [Shinella sp.]|nr:thermonuclease family protein [Shinella sp.]